MCTFKKFASQKVTKDGMILCPCVNCVNSAMLTLDVVHDHIISFGFRRVMRLGYFMGNNCLQQLLVELMQVIFKKSLMNAVIFMPCCMMCFPCRIWH